MVKPKYKKRAPTVWERLPVIMDSETLAIVLGLSAVQVRTLAREGKIPAVRVGKQWRFEKTRIMQFAGAMAEDNYE
ncbi:MAG: helix-turn-helix domain-containing protein [Oscillospiraceae bacterium]